MSIVHSFSKLSPVAVVLFAVGGVVMFLNNPGVFFFVLLVAGSYWAKTEYDKQEGIKKDLLGRFSTEILSCRVMAAIKFWGVQK